MNLLLDTHVLLWWLADHPRLKAAARALISSPDNEVFVSAATAWEIAIKQALGKLDFDDELERVLAEQGFTLLPITFAHAAETRALPAIHQDPFDRMLVAQARVEKLRLITADARIPGYPADVLAC